METPAIPCASSEPLGSFHSSLLLPLRPVLAHTVCQGRDSVFSEVPRVEGALQNTVWSEEEQSQRYSKHPERAWGGKTRNVEILPAAP